MADNTLYNIFNTIRTKITGAKTSKIDRQINYSLNRLDSITKQSNQNDFVNAVRDAINQYGKDSQNNDDNINKLVSDQNPIQSQEHQHRLQRYKEFGSIVSKISYCKRALKVLTDNIVAPDDISKRSLEFLFPEKTQASETDTSEATIKTRLKEINDQVEVDKNLDTIISSTLQYGDYFAEIVETTGGNNLPVVLSEGTNKIPSSKKDVEIDNGNNQKEQKSIKLMIEDFHRISKNISENNSLYNFKGTQTYKDIASPQTGSASNKFQGKFTSYSEESPKLDDLFVVYHSPENVVKLESKRFRTNFGYLVFPSIQEGNNDNVNQNSVDSICKDIITGIKNKVQNNDLNLTKKDLKPIVGSFLEKVENDEDLIVRFVPPNHMVHYKLTETNKYFPYGESIFDSVLFDARLLMMLKVSNSIKRATSAQDKRLISVETGLPREAGNLVNNVKESMRKRKFSVDDMGSIDSIPSHISTFEDIYVPMKDGKKYVEFDSARWDQPFDSDVDSMKFIRDNIVANLMVPAPYLGLEENTSNRQLLTSENVIFTRAVVAYQKIFSSSMHELFVKLYKLVYNDNNEGLKDLKVTLPMPKTSVYGFEIDYLDKVSRVIDSLTEYGVPQDYLLRRYMPQFDWEEINRQQSKDKIEDNLTGGEDEDEGMGF